MPAVRHTRALGTRSGLRHALREDCALEMTDNVLPSWRGYSWPPKQADPLRYGPCSAFCRGSVPSAHRVGCRRGVYRRRRRRRISRRQIGRDDVGCQCHSCPTGCRPLIAPVGHAGEHGQADRSARAFSSGARVWPRGRDENNIAGHAKIIAPTRVATRPAALIPHSRSAGSGARCGRVACRRARRRRHPGE